MKHLLHPMILTGIILLLMLIGTIIGQTSLPWHELYVDNSWNPVVELRFHRMLTALVTGVSLALSGAVFQAVMRNPLAEPFTLGISGGAGVGAALSFVSGFYLKTFLAVPLGAFTGALAVLTLVLGISRGGGRGGDSLLLSGVIAGTIASGILMYLLSISGSDHLAGITWWMLGDLQSADPQLLGIAGAAAATAAVFLHFSADWIDMLSLGAERAWQLGVNPVRFTIVLVVIASLLAAETVALAGIIGFCGLIVPHAVRKIYGSSHRKMLIPTALWGGIFLMSCDLVSRLLLPGRELPIGVTTSLLGGPIFLWLLNFRRKR